MTRITRINVAAILFDSYNHVLLCKRSRNKKVAPGMWHLPGGKIEENETPEIAIARELKEELDIEVTKTIITPIDYIYSVGEELHKTIFTYVEATGEPNLNHENEEYRYVSPTEIKVLIESHLVEINLKAIETCLLIKG